MKPLLVHNFYQQVGGEDTAFETEKHLLMAAGLQVAEYVRHNAEITEYGVWPKATLGLRTIRAWDSVRELRHLLQIEKPDVAHFHNTFPLISPAAYEACQESGVPVVQTLHNYRLFCPAATLSRDGHVCQECLQHSLWRAVRYACYRGSRLASATAALMLTVNRWMQTWVQMVNCYIVPSKFARSKFIEAGLKAEKIFVKPHCVYPDPGLRDGPGEYVLFVGRLSPEKGLNTLLAAWEQLGNRIPLRIVGDGPLRPVLEAEASRRRLSSISFVGLQSRDQIFVALRRASFLVSPSELYESFGMAIVEAFACGVPVVASRLGAMEEIVENGRTGLHFTPADSNDLAEKVAWAWAHPDQLEEMSLEARKKYESNYAADKNFPILMEIYQRVLGRPLFGNHKN